MNKIEELQRRIIFIEAEKNELARILGDVIKNVICDKCKHKILSRPMHNEQDPMREAILDRRDLESRQL